MAEMLTASHFENKQCVIWGLPFLRNRLQITLYETALLAQHDVIKIMDGMILLLLIFSLWNFNWLKL